MWHFCALYRFSMIFLTIPGVVSVFTIPGGRKGFIPQTSIGTRDSGGCGKPFVPDALSFTCGDGVVCGGL